MSDKNIVELKIDVEFLDRERVKIIETLQQILKRLDDMDDEITTKNLIVTEKTTTKDLEVTNLVVEDLELSKNLVVGDKTTTNDLEVDNQVTGDLALAQNLTVANKTTTHDLEVGHQVTGDLALAQNLTVADTITTEDLAIGSGELTVTELTTTNETVSNELTINGETRTKDVLVRNAGGAVTISLLGDDPDIVINS